MEPQANQTAKQEHIEEEAPGYVPPMVITYRGEEILDFLGPAQACTFGGSLMCADDSPFPLLDPLSKIISDQI